MDEEGRREGKINRTFRATETELSAYDNAAAAAGISTSEFIRRTLNRECGDRDKEASAKRTRDDILDKNLFLVRRILEELVPEDKRDDVLARAMKQAKEDLAEVEEIT